MIKILEVGGEISQNSQILSGRLGGEGRRGQSRIYIGGGLGIGLPKVEKSPIISVVNFVRKEFAPLPLVTRSRRCFLVLLGSGASFLLGLSGWMVVQARGVTEAAMAAQLHEVLCLQVTCQV